MTKRQFSLKWKLILWLSLIGFTTSFFIHLTLLMLGNSDIGYNMRQYPVMKWQQASITEALADKINSQPVNQQQPVLNQHMLKLISESEHQVYSGDKLFTKLTISAFAVIDLNSNLLLQSEGSTLTAGDVGSQIPITTRDDLADALTGHFNSGIEPLENNNYLVIKSIMDQQQKILGAIISWQSWKIEDDRLPYFYISLSRGLTLALLNTLASFMWILPSTVILGWLVARIITSRYHHLYRVIEDWGNGNLNSRIKTTGSDEISTSFHRLNQMAEKIAHYQKEQVNLSSINERQHLAAELHDTVKQQLFAANLQLSAAAQQLETAPDKAKQNLDKAIEQNRTAFQQVNDLIFTLSPISIGGNLKDALVKAMDEWQKNNKIQLSYQLDFDNSPGDSPGDSSGNSSIKKSDNSSNNIKLTEIQQQTVFRSIMEALQNCLKHANANKIEVILEQKSSKLIWTVTDNGNTVDQPISFGQGLNLMKKRIESINGELEINNVNGFQLKANFPL